MKRFFGIAAAASVLSISSAWPQDQQRQLLQQELRQKTNRELLNDLEAKLPDSTTKPTILPSPNRTTIEVGTPVPRGGGGERALKNLRDEEANRTQRQILEQLK